MAEYIPFLTGKDACRLVRQYYPSPTAVRVLLQSAAEMRHHMDKWPLWLDPGVDGLDDVETRRSTDGRQNPWCEYMLNVPRFDEISAQAFLAQPKQEALDIFVYHLLDACAEFNPTWISVPQLPMVNDTSRNKINRGLAKAAGSWKDDRDFEGKLILPVVVTNQKQINGKTERNPKVKNAATAYRESHAEGIWVVDKSLSDDSGSKTLRDTRFPGLIAFHEELNVATSSPLRIGGPYWGINLVLWARQLIDFPAIGVGNGYQYFLAGGHASTATPRVVIAPLRRRAELGQLGAWLETSMKTLGHMHPAFTELKNLHSSLSVLGQDTAREQVAKAYKSWFDQIAGTPCGGRSLALFQDLSAAYTLGKSLPPLPTQGTAKRPESVAEPLMLSCL